MAVRPSELIFVFLFWFVHVNNVVMFGHGEVNGEGIPQMSTKTSGMLWLERNFHVSTRMGTGSPLSLWL